MTLPDPEDPDFRAEIHILAIQLGGAIIFLFAVLCLGIAYLSP